MNKPLIKLDVELWEKSGDFLKHGLPWYMWVAWFFLSPKFYQKMKGLANDKSNFARGVYDKFRDKIIICLNDISASTIFSTQAHKIVNGQVHAPDYHKSFGLQVYFTLVHEMLHKVNVAKDDSNGGHKVDFDKFEKLPMSLQDMFDGLLEMEYSNDNFTNHPENRREK